MLSLSHHSRALARIVAICAVTALGCSENAGSPGATGPTSDSAASSTSVASTDPPDTIATENTTSPAGADAATPTNAVTPSPSTLSTQVDVTVACSRGDRLSELPFDAATIPWLDTSLDETPWASRIVTITNRSPTTVTVEPGFLVRYLDIEGSEIGEAADDEPFRAAYSARTDQTIHRAAFRFQRTGLPGLVPDADLAELLFADLGSCELGEDVAVVPTHADQSIDAALAEHVDLVDCSFNDTTAQHESILQVTNPREDAMHVEFAYEILDRNGTRLGIGGNISDRVEPASQAKIVGWAAPFTIVDIEQAADCRLLALTAN